MRRDLALPVVLLLCLGVFAGCSSGDAKDASATTSSGGTSSPSPSSTASPSGGASSGGSSSPSAPATSATSSPSASSSPSTTDVATLPTVRIEAADMHKAVLGQNAASGSDQQAVVDAWMRYWQGAADSYYYYRPTQDFDAVARGVARSSVVGYIDRLKAADKRVVGWAQDNIQSVTVKGDQATVRDCTKNFTFTVDNEAEPLTHPTPYYDVTGTLVRTDGGWTVTKQTSKSLNKSCLS